MISQDKLLQTYDQESYNYFLLDVRTSAEFQEKHLSGSVNICIDEIEKRIAEIPTEKHIIVICEHGFRSGLVEKFLQDKGFQADSLDAGLAVWKGQLN